MLKCIELVLVEDETGVYFGLRDGSAPAVVISQTWPAKSGHDAALERFGALLAFALSEAQDLPPGTPASTVPPATVPPATT